MESRRPLKPSPKADINNGQVHNADSKFAGQEASSVLRHNVTQAQPIPCNTTPQACPPHRSRVLSGPSGSIPVLNPHGIYSEAFRRSTVSSLAKVSPGVSSKGSVPIVRSDVAGSSHASTSKPGNSANISDVTRRNPTTSSFVRRPNLQWGSRIPAGPAIAEIPPESNMQQKPPPTTRVFARLASRDIPSVVRHIPVSSSKGLPEGKGFAVGMIRGAQPASALDTAPSMSRRSDRIAYRVLKKEKYPATASSKDPHIGCSTSQSKMSYPMREVALRSVAKGKAPAVTTTPTNARLPPILKPWGSKKTRTFVSQPQEQEQEQEHQQDPSASHHIRFKAPDTFEDRQIKPFGERCQLCNLDLAFTQGESQSYNDDPPVHAVLPCGHCYHYSCLEGVFGRPEPSQTPTCINCTDTQMQN